MSATNSTTNYNLPVFVGTDKPAWLTDWNGAINTIDSVINSVSTAQQGDATAISTLNSSIQALGDTVSDHTTAITSLNSQVSGNTGSINTINSLLGNGEPTTTDKTIIGAINELNAKAVDADHVGYDNTNSGLSATTVQGAIDQITNGISDKVALNIDANTYSTYGDAITPLAIAYTTLSAEEKVNAYILWGGAIVDVTANNGVFSRVQSDTNGFTITTIDLSNNMWVNRYLSNADDFTATAQNTAIKLCVRK